MSNRIIAVTGAFGILGRATVQHLLSQGHCVALLDVSEPRGDLGLTADQSDYLVVGGVDLTDGAATRAAIDKVVSHFGGLDGLVNIAGGFVWTSLEDSDADTWQQMFDMNVKTAMNTCHAAVGALKKSSAGRIVNIGAAGAVKADMGMGPYAASKAGVMRLTESLAQELKGDDVCVNAVLPSIIDTPRNREDMPDADFTAWVKPEALADVIAFLLSDAGHPITGALIPVIGRV